MKKITEAELGEKAMALLDEAGDEGVFITRDGKILARLTPLRSSGHLIGSLKGLAGPTDPNDELLSALDPHYRNP